MDNIPPSFFTLVCTMETENILFVAVLACIIFASCYFVLSHVRSPYFEAAGGKAVLKAVPEADEVVSVDVYANSTTAGEGDAIQISSQIVSNVDGVTFMELRGYDCSGALKERRRYNIAFEKGDRPYSISYSMPYCIYCQNASIPYVLSITHRVEGKTFTSNLSVYDRERQK